MIVDIVFMQRDFQGHRDSDTGLFVFSGQQGQRLDWVHPVRMRKSAHVNQVRAPVPAADCRRQRVQPGRCLGGVNSVGWGA